MSIPYVEYNQTDGHQNADARDDAHTDEQTQRNGAQVPTYDGPVLGDLHKNERVHKSEGWVGLGWLGVNALTSSFRDAFVWFVWKGVD